MVRIGAVRRSGTSAIESVRLNTTVFGIRRIEIANGD